MDKRRQRTREAIEAAFVELIDERGYAKTTVQDILERSGVGRATFYAQFHGKDDLLEAQVCALCDHALDMGAATSVSPLAQTERVLENLLDRRGGLHALIVDEGSERFADCLRHAIVARADAAVPACPRGAAARMNRSFLLHHIAASFVGMVRWWAWNDFAATPHDLATDYLNAILPLFGGSAPVE